MHQTGGWLCQPLILSADESGLSGGELAVPPWEGWAAWPESWLLISHGVWLHFPPHSVAGGACTSACMEMVYWDVYL